MRRRLPLSAALLVSGLVLASAPVASGAERAAKTGTFRALTYNVAGLPEPLSGSEPATNSPLISPRLNAYEVVLLQEDWADVLAQHGLRTEDDPGIPRTGYHDLIVADAEHAYRTEPASSPPPPDNTVRRLPTGPTLSGDGLNHLSTLPLGDVQRVMWADCFGEVHVTALEEAVTAIGAADVIEADGGSADCGAQKGFSVTTLELTDGVTVDLYDLHADAGGGESDRMTRRKNFEQLAVFILQPERVGRPVLLGGDTNLRTRESTDRERFDSETWSAFLAATGLSDVCEVVSCGIDGDEIDKFAFRSSEAVKLIPQSHSFERAAFTRDDGEPLSDHDALAVQWHWVARPRRG